MAISPPLLNPEEDGPSLLLFVTPPPAEYLANQVGRLTFILLSSWGLEAAVIGIAIFGVWSGRMALAESRPVDVCLQTIYGLNSGVFLSTLLHMPYPDRRVVWRSVQSVFTRLFTQIIACFSAPQDMCICMSAHHHSMDCFTLRWDANRLRRRPESPFTCSYIWSTLDHYLSTYSSV